VDTNKTRLLQTVAKREAMAEEEVVLPTPPFPPTNTNFSSLLRTSFTRESREPDILLGVLVGLQWGLLSLLQL